MPGTALELEDVLDHAEPLHAGEFHPELLAELPVQRLLGGLPELDPAAEGAVERLSLDGVVALEHQQLVPAAHDAQHDRPDHGRECHPRATARATRSPNNVGSSMPAAPAIVATTLDGLNEQYGPASRNQGRPSGSIRKSNNP